MVGVIVPLAPPPEGLPTWIYWVFIGFYSLMILVLVASIIFDTKDKNRRKR